MIAFLDDQRRGRQGGAYERRVMAPISRRRIVSLLAPFHLDSRRLSPLTEQGPGWRRLTTVGGPAAPTSPDASAAGRVHDDGDRFAPRQRAPPTWRVISRPGLTREDRLEPS